MPCNCLILPYFDLCYLSHLSSVFIPAGKEIHEVLDILNAEIKKKLLQIVDGNFSPHNRSDTVLVEEKLIPGYGFEKFCEHGLADIRIIVANLVPVMAMLRMPTKASG